MSDEYAATFGCLFFALVLDQVLYGASTVLVLQYFCRSFRRDHTLIQCLIAFLWIISTLQATTIVASVYVSLIVHFGDDNSLDYIPNAGVVHYMSTFLIAFTAQLYFMTQIWRLSRTIALKWLFTLPTFLAAMLSLVAGIVQVAVLAMNHQTLVSSTARHFQICTIIQTLATVACDVGITAALCCVLSRNRTGLRRTDDIISKLRFFALQRGAATSITAIISTVAFIVKPHTYIYSVSLLPSSQFYVICIVSSLNFRKRLNQEDEKNTTQTPTWPESGDDLETKTRFTSNPPSPYTPNSNLKLEDPSSPEIHVEFRSPDSDETLGHWKPDRIAADVT